MRNRLTTFWYGMENSLSFVNEEINQADYSKIEKYLIETPELKKYEYYFKKINRSKEHEPSKIENDIISEIQIMNKGIENSASVLRNTEIDHGTIDGKKLNRHVYNEYIKSEDQQRRKEVFSEYWGGYKKVQNTFASLHINHLQYSTLLKKVYKYKSMLEMKCTPNEVPITVYDNLVNIVNENINVVHKYNNFLKEIYGLDTMHSYDLMLPVVKETSKKYTYEEAKEMILKSLKPLGNKYISDLKEILNKNIIDLKSRKNKTAGYYSIGAYKHLPLILASYDGSIKSVSSLAHELGHAMCSYYSSENLFVYNDCDKFVIEVPSLVNQIIFYDCALKKAETKEEKLEILYQLLELYNNNLFFATKCAEFEKYAHDIVEEKGNVSSKTLYDKYLELTKKYDGDAVKVSDEAKYEWLNTWQLYNDYYLYQYATGIIAATYIAESILNGKKIDKYLEFLKTGSSIKPTEALEKAGVDLTKPETIISTIKVFNNYFNQFKEIYRS